MRTVREDPLRRIIRLSVELARVMRQRAAGDTGPRIGISFFQLHALLLVREHPHLMMSQLAKLLRITSPSATSLVTRLSRQGLLRRIHDPTNRKIVRLCLTLRAQRLIGSALRHRERVLKSFLSRIPSKDRVTFARILEQILTPERPPHL
jgi:DNA-binding MarR family transcriptional regulator